MKGGLRGMVVTMVVSSAVVRVPSPEWLRT
jgi:hypothetical protein